MPSSRQVFVHLEQAPDAKVLVISVAARMAGMHPQTLRQYDRLGLVQPGRAAGGSRRYSARDVALLQEIQRLSQDEGVNLAGIKRIIELEQSVAALKARIQELESELEEAHRARMEIEAAARAYRRDLVPVRETALVVWRPGKQKPDDQRPG